MKGMTAAPKSGKKGKAPGYRKYPMGVQTKVVETEFYDAQGAFAKNSSAEMMDQYAKPGTTASSLQSDPYSTSYPISRYRSRRP